MPIKICTLNVLLVRQICIDIFLIELNLSFYSYFVLICSIILIWDMYIKTMTIKCFILLSCTRSISHSVPSFHLSSWIFSASLDIAYPLVRTIIGCSDRWVCNSCLWWHWWFNGRILACHVGGPRSIPGQCKSSYFSLSLMTIILDARYVWTCTLHSIHCSFCMYQILYCYFLLYYFFTSLLVFYFVFPSISVESKRIILCNRGTYSFVVYDNNL